MSRWFCNYCDAEFNEPVINAGMPEDEHWFRSWQERTCPKCGSTDIVEMDRCPECIDGWTRPERLVCDKCHLKLKGILHRLANEHSFEALVDMDNMLEGTSLTSFR